MSQFDELLLILGAIYLGECLYHLRLGAVAVVAFFGGAFRVRHPASLIGDGTAGLCPVSPLPWAVALVAEQWPVSLSPRGVLAYVAQAINPLGRPAQSERFIPWNQVKSVGLDDKRILINGEPFVRAATRAVAERLAALLRQIRDAPAPERERLILAALAESFDEPALVGRWQSVRAPLAGLRISCTVLFVYVFVLLPLTYWYLPFLAAAPFLLLGFLGVLILAVRRYRLIHRSLHPLRKGERLRVTIMLVLAPTAAMRSAHTAAREAVAGFHPLAVVHALCPPARFAAFARAVVLDTRHPMPPPFAAADPAAAETEAWFRAGLTAQVDRCVESAGLNVADLLAAPAPESPDIRAYCPRCRLQYTAVGNTCAACGGMPLAEIGAN